MNISFIITSYNVAPYIDQCLNSLMGCVRPGDEVILVDDGSSDRTDILAETRFAAGFGPDVATQLVLLGANTMGGVGIPANIGMAQATREAVFFVDGDDWMEPAGFRACRAAFDASRPDILIGNYLEQDEATGHPRQPSDILRWADLPAATTPQGRRKLALSLIGVPWRKFYRRDFLIRSAARFPEGNFFYEDNPFHWQICLAADTIGFHDAILCRHRMNRPGQTMAATGLEFLAFFDHYETICRLLPDQATELQAAALEWLVGNMSWTTARMAQGVFWAYAARAAQALEGRGQTWATIRSRYADSAIGGMVEALVRGEVAGTVAAWMADRTLQRIDTLHARVDGLLADTLGREPERGAGASAGGSSLAEQMQALRLIEEFRALRALHDADTIVAPTR